MSTEAEVAQVEEVIPETEQEVTEQSAQTEDTEAKPEEQKPEEETLPKGVQRRINRAVRRQYEAEAEAKMLKQRIAEIEQRMNGTPSQQQADKEPQLAEFDTIEDYTKAVARFYAQRESKTLLSQSEQATQQEKAQAAQREHETKWLNKVEKFTALQPDYEEVVGSADINFVDPIVFESIKASPMGAEIAYYLARNPDEAEDIGNMTGIAGVLAIGELGAKLASKKVSVTKTPPPARPLGNKAAATVNPDKMSYEDFVKWRNKQQT